VKVFSVSFADPERISQEIHQYQQNRYQQNRYHQNRYVIIRIGMLSSESVCYHQNRYVIIRIISTRINFIRIRIKSHQIKSSQSSTMRRYYAAEFISLRKRATSVCLFVRRSQYLMIIKPLQSLWNCHT